ncbi:MAG TPA: FliG C-terminal domain-containing protein [Pirellulales bacterium]|nr:FliG C-terminal domain-containing protein [Pirellulales bacterium]
MRDRNLGIRKAAILIASLDARSAEMLLREMSPSQAHAVREAADRLGPLDLDEQNEVIDEFFRIGPLLPEKQPAGIELDSRPLVRSVPLSSAGGNEFGRGGAETPPLAHTLRDASIHLLAPFLERERPQTIAVVVSHLPTDRAAEVLANLPAELQIEVARRLVDLDETDPEVLRDIERGLESWLREQLESDRRRSVGITALNNILGAATPRAKRHILANLERHDRQLASKIKLAPERPMTFADVEQLDAASLTVVLHHADSQVLVLALAGARPEMAERAFELFPFEEVQSLRRALCELGPTRLSDVEDAQRELADLAHQLEIRGEIAPAKRGRLSVAV